MECVYVLMRTFKLQVKYFKGLCLREITEMMVLISSIPWNSMYLSSVVHTLLVYSMPGSGRSPGGGHGNPLQYSCLENPHGQRSLAGYRPWGCTESDMTEPT